MSPTACRYSVNYRATTPQNLWEAGSCHCDDATNIDKGVIIMYATG